MCFACVLCDGEGALYGHANTYVDCLIDAWRKTGFRQLLYVSLNIEGGKMQVRKRGNWIHLLKSSYHRYDEISKVGGRTTLSLAHKFPASATEVPEEVKGSLTEEELERVMNVAIIPAREEQARRTALEVQASEAVARHAIDPNWRLERAIEVMLEAANSLQTMSPELDFDRVAKIMHLCVDMAIRAGAFHGDSVRPVSQLLGTMATATSKIAQHVSDTKFPSVAKGNAKENLMYKGWQVTGKARDELQVAMQKKRYVQKRSG